MEIEEGRNKKIYEEFLNGASLVDLGVKYSISSTRVRSIVKDEKRKEEYNANDIYRMIATMSEDKKLVTRTYNVLKRLNATTKEEILKIDKKTLKNTRTCGEKIEDVIMKLQEVIENNNR